MTSEIKNKAYSSVQDELDALSITKKEKLISLGLAGISSLLLVLGPITFFANMLIFTNYQILFSFLIAVSIIVFIFLTDFLYLHLISKKRVEGLYHIWTIDIMFVSIVIFVIYFGLAKFVFKLL